MTAPPLIAEPAGRRVKTREALVAAGLRLLAAKPIDAISIDEIVQEAGVAKGSFYNHFDDKDGLARTIAGRIQVDVEREVEAANRDIEDPARRVVRAVCVYIRHALTDRQRASVLLRLHADASHAEAPMNRGVLADVSNGLAKGRFAIPSAEVGVLLIMGLAQMALSRAHGEPDPEVAIRLGQQLCSLILRGLGLAFEEADAIAEQAAREIVRSAPGAV